MFVWLIPELLAKAAITDPAPHEHVARTSTWPGRAEGTELSWLVVAQEANSSIGLFDDPRDDPQQRNNLATAVSAALAKLILGQPQVIACIYGRSRSCVTACLVQALWQQRPFLACWADLRKADPSVVSESPLFGLAAKMFPQLFETES